MNKSDKAFYTTKKSKINISKYNDLYNHVIGTKLGVLYFDRFDNDKSLKKIVDYTYQNNLNNLINERYSVTIITESQGDFLIKNMGLQNEIKKSTYKYTKKNPVYFGISKKSENQRLLSRFRKILTEMVQSGETEIIIINWFKDYDLEVPNFK